MSDWVKELERPTIDTSAPTITTTPDPDEIHDVDAFLSSLGLTSQEPGCEVKHRTTICSVKVVAKITSCVMVVLSCESHLGHVRDLVKRGNVCRGCRRKIPECWTILPI